MFRQNRLRKATSVLMLVTAAALIFTLGVWIVCAVSLSFRQKQAAPQTVETVGQRHEIHYIPKRETSQENEGSSETPPYLVKFYYGKAAVFRAGETEPLYTAEGSAEQLPEGDRALLRAGIPAQTLSEARAILEDYE